MSKLKCKCGHIIFDQTDNLTNKGYVLPDTKFDDIFSGTIEKIDDLSEATKTNKRIEWIKTNFNVPPYPIDLKDSSMIHDLLSDKIIDSMKTIYECAHCGRIAIQLGHTENFKFFNPDSDDTKGILNGNDF